MAIVGFDPDFDMFAPARSLREAGVPAKQAEAHAEAARTIRAGLATKADLDGLESRFDARLTALETRSNARIADLRADIVPRLVGADRGVRRRHDGAHRRVQALRVAAADKLAHRPAPACGRDMAIAEADPDFDTLAYARSLREAGVPGKQAEAHTEAARTIRAGLATKADLDSLETRPNARIADLRADMAALETRLAVRFFGGAIVSAIELLQAALRRRASPAPCGCGPGRPLPRSGPSGRPDGLDDGAAAGNSLARRLAL